MSAEKIASFYQDPTKRACDAASLAKAFYLRSLYTETGFAWRSRRAAKFIGQLAGSNLRQTVAEPLARRLGRGSGDDYRERDYAEA